MSLCLRIGVMPGGLARCRWIGLGRFWVDRSVYIYIYYIDCMITRSVLYTAIAQSRLLRLDHWMVDIRTTHQDSGLKTRYPESEPNLHVLNAIWRYTSRTAMRHQQCWFRPWLSSHIIHLRFGTRLVHHTKTCLAVCLWSSNLILMLGFHLRSYFPAFHPKTHGLGACVAHMCGRPL